MADTTGISWTDSTFNPWIGCTKVSPACDHCYAERGFAQWRGVVQWGAGQPRKRTGAANWKKPRQWNAQAFVQCQACGWRGEWRDADERCGACPGCNQIPELFTPARRRVFCASLADVFDNEVPAEWRRDLFKLIIDAPNLDFLLLTKRIGNASRMIEQALIGIGDGATDALWRWPLHNAWIGATICNQEEADRDVPKLLATPAAVRFLSVEPMLGPIDLERACDIAERSVFAGTWSTMADPQRCAAAWRHGIVRLLDWVIVGGESGPQARPMHPDWPRGLRDQCEEAGVPYHFKQWGEWCPRRPESLGYPSVDSVPRFRMTSAGDNGQSLSGRGGDDVWMNRVGKAVAGRLLDGRTHDGFPEGAA